MLNIPVQCINRHEESVNPSQYLINRTTGQCSQRETIVATSQITYQNSKNLGEDLRFYPDGEVKNNKGGGRMEREDFKKSRFINECKDYDPVYFLDDNLAQIEPE